MNRWLQRALSACAFTLSLAGLAGAQQSGSIIVQVLESANSGPIRGAQVHVVGTEIGALTNAEGRAQLTNVPVGSRT